MQGEAYGEPADARSIIARSLEGNRPESLDRHPSGVVQRIVERQISLVNGVVEHRQRLPSRLPVRVHGRVGWDLFLIVATDGSGVGAAAVVDANGDLLEVTDLASATARWTVVPSSTLESQAILQVLSGLRDDLLGEASRALTDVVRLAPGTPVEVTHL